MKNAKRFLLLILCVILVMPLFNSCKIGDEDPGFSLYTRRARLCQDWSFSYYKHSQQHGDSIVSNEYDGSSYITVYGTKSYISNAKMTISFNKKGTYTWDEYISCDTSVYTYKEEGYWYFTGGGKDTDTKFRELLALQKIHSKTLQVAGVTTSDDYTASGNLETTVYRLIKLSRDEVKMESKVEKQHIIGSNTVLDINNTIINLKMGAK